MCKAVMISIRPKWCEKICRGEKTVEVRKTRPKLQTPFKVYIYCTKAKGQLIAILKDGDENYGEIYHGKPVFIKQDDGSVCDMWGNRQKVIAEFICDRIFPINVFDNGSIQNWIFEHMERSCLTYEELAGYIGNGETGYGWHISNLKIYDTPKELSKFSRPFENCIDKVCDEFGCESCENGGHIKRPPQSWYYVEEM